MKISIKIVSVIIVALGVLYVADKFGCEWLNDGEVNNNGVFLLIVALVAAFVPIVLKKRKMKD